MVNGLFARRKSLGPSTGFEILVPGRQDLLCGAAIPLAGAPISLDLRRAFFFYGTNLRIFTRIPPDLRSFRWQRLVPD